MYTSLRTLLNRFLVISGNLLVLFEDFGAAPRNSIAFRAAMTSLFNSGASPSRTNIGFISDSNK